MTNKKKLVVGISLALFTGSAMAANPPADEQTLLVMFKPSVSKEQRENVVRSVGGLLQATDDTGRDLRMRHIAQGRINKILVANAAQRDRAIKRLSRHPLIEVAEPNYLLTHADPQQQPLNQPNDEFFDLMWGLHNTGQSGGTVGADISALDAWEITQGDSNIVIGVIDEGVDYNHPDLVANIWQNPGEICDNGIDDTGTGVIDDCHGFNAIDGSGDPMDEGGHGTHVAGTIGASANNGIGVAGVNWDVQIAGCKFLGPDGGFTSDAIACLDYFTNLRINHNVNIVATNNSWGGGPFSETLRSAIQSHNDAGILFVAAAGNSGMDADISPMYPAAYDLPGIISVANSTRTDELALDSTYGEVSVDLAAPGTQIASTFIDDSYVYMSGTSMAAPHVAGVAGLMWSIAPHLSIAEVKQIMMDSGDPLPALAGRTVSGKRLNAYRALVDADPVPGFALSLNPLFQQVTAGNAADYTLDITSVADWTGDVSLTVSVDPALDYDLSSSTAATGDSLTLTLSTEPDTPWGDYTIDVSAEDLNSGEYTGQAFATLSVLPDNLVDFPYENNTSVDIPDANPEGITSVITVADEGVVFGAEVSVDITHTWRSDLIVSLTSPQGTEHILHNRDGGSEDDLIESWSVDSFNGEEMTGDWTLMVSDNAAADTGTLNSWRLVLSAASDSEPLPAAPTAAYSYTVDGMTVNFSNESDADFDIVSYDWDFGDGASSSDENPVHTYAAEGSYSVTLTVTDAEGQTDSTSEMINISLTNITVEVLSAARLRTGSAVVQLMVSGAEGPVDVYRDSQFIGTYDSSRIRDRFRTSADSVTYEVCPQGSAGGGCTTLTHSF